MRKALILGTLLTSAVLIASQAHAQCGGAFGVSICGQVVISTPPLPVIPLLDDGPRAKVPIIE